MRHNTLNYKRKAETPGSQQEDQASSSAELCQDNCCTLLLIFIIFVLSVLLMLAVMRCYYLDHNPLTRLVTVDRSTDNYSRNTLTTDKPFTFFPF